MVYQSNGNSEYGGVVLTEEEAKKILSHNAKRNGIDFDNFSQNCIEDVKLAFSDSWQDAIEEFSEFKTFAELAEFFDYDVKCDDCFCYYGGQDDNGAALTKGMECSCNMHCSHYGDAGEGDEDSVYGDAGEGDEDSVPRVSRNKQGIIGY